MCGARSTRAGRSITPYAALVNRLVAIDEDVQAAGRPAAASLMDRSLEEWERAMAKAVLRRGLQLSG